MSTPTLSGALEGLHVLGVDDLPRIKRSVEAGRQLGFAYFVPYLISRNRPGKTLVLVEEDGDSICLFTWRQREVGPRLDLTVAPTPLTPSVLRKALERANDFNEDRSAKVLRIDEQDVEVAREVRGLRVSERKSQYLYDPAALVDLSGRRFRTLRRNVVRIREMPSIEVSPYRPEHAEECRELLKRWRTHHRETHGTRGGAGTSARAIAIANELSAPDLHGEIIRLEGRLVAFALGGEIRPGIGCFFEAKTDVTVPGLSYFQRWSFLSKQTGLERVNDGSDAGREGLKQLKRSLRPVAMHVEFRGRQDGD